MLRKEFFYEQGEDILKSQPDIPVFPEPLTDEDRLLIEIYAPDPVTGQPCPSNALTIPNTHPEFFNIVSKLYNSLPRTHGAATPDDAESLLVSSRLQYGQEIVNIRHQLEAIINSDDPNQTVQNSTSTD